MSGLGQSAAFAPRFKLISAERWDEMLGAVPPALHTPAGFLVGEPSSYRACQVTGAERLTYPAFQRLRTTFYEALEPMTVAEFRALTADMVRKGPQP